MELTCIEYLENVVYLPIFSLKKKRKISNHFLLFSLFSMHFFFLYTPIILCSRKSFKNESVAPRSPRAKKADFEK